MAMTARIMPSVPLIGDIVGGDDIVVGELPRMGDIDLGRQGLPRMGDTPIGQKIDTGGAHLSGKHPDKGNMIDVMA